MTGSAVSPRLRSSGSDLYVLVNGTADGAAMEQYPPDPADPRRPSDISDLDGGRVIVLAKRLNHGVARIRAAAREAEARGEAFALTSDLRLFATTAWLA